MTPDEKTVTAFRCVCGAAARVLARVPEVPADLLCECGRVPNDPTFDQSIRFPRAYQSLAMPRPEWEDALRSEKVTPERTPRGERRKQIIDTLTRTPGQTTLQIAESTGMSTAQVAFHLRSDPAFVAGETVQPELPARGPQPRTWSVLEGVHTEA